MGGSNCAIVGCGTCNAKHKGLSFHRLPKKGKSVETDKWRKLLIIGINRTDPGFNPDTATVCSRHFDEACFTPHGNGRKLKFGSVPNKFMPSKSIETPRQIPRKETVHRTPPPVPERVYYKDIEDIHADLQRVTLPWTIVKDQNSGVKLGIVSGSSFERLVSINTNFDVSLLMNGVPVQRPFDITRQPLKKLLDEVKNIAPCSGIIDPELQTLAELPSESTGPYYRHIVCTQSETRMVHSSTVRAHKCLGHTNDGTQCSECTAVLKLLNRRTARSMHVQKAQLHPKTPLHRIGQKRLAVALQDSRRSVKRLEIQKAQIAKKLCNEGVPVTSGLHQSLKQLIESQDIKNPFLKLFWKEQEKGFSKGRGGMRWHPMLIRFAILIHSQSPAAYRTLRETGCMKLPGESTLRDYTNAVHPQQGFNNEVIQEIKQATSGLTPNQRWVVLLHDEMAIKADLVYDQSTGDIVGFLDSANWIDNTPSESDLATHVLVFMVVGVNSHLKMSLGYFPTCTAKAEELYPIFWRAVSILELECGLKVIATTCDKASPNQKLLRIHNAGNFCYKTRNQFAREREIFFISDVPHLVKTVRNNLWSSKTGGSRYLWNNGQNLLWDHVKDIYNEDAGRELYQTKLTDEHVNLTPHSVMRVNLAAQVLSQSVGRVMEAYGGPEKAETAKLIKLMDRFFDCFNVRALREGDRKRKPDLLPYQSVDDPRFVFLEEEFLGYLKAWKESVMGRPGFTKTEKNKMFLSYQTYEGLQVTVKSITEATKYLLSNGVSFVLTHVFCQDPIEEHFSRHRALGQRADNPTLWGFGYQENKLRLQRSIAMQLKPRGNVRGKRVQEPIIISTSPLKKRRPNAQ